ncbi:hypothetical protein E8D34_14490 [Nocardioides sp. GY 10113]|uniref:DUF5994 family protein n=1 Tax=Nocardioides sp. GY 10113 TaxID=2569761 RepID=UPI0010A84D27|nr:DUF5994 family protein [Nocardioides sp. GY 10113]TIC79766.1 hypothetical protein E8D34_19890 [Nocardioides sp. GY 10113]TIC84906.1 hypothetical protein E8D34_14490 [Nocardioides sp. GY 10113]
MATSNGPHLVAVAEPIAASRSPLRLRMARTADGNHLDGGWWPQSRDLAVELADLVDHFPRTLGRVVRALVSPPDWDAVPRVVRVGGRSVKVGAFPRDDTHLIHLTTSDRTLLHVLVVPPGFTPDQGEEALLAAATSGNAHSGTELLREVTEHPDVDPMDHWSDDGGAWWGSGRLAPSYRVGERGR